MTNFSNITHAEAVVKLWRLAPQCVDNYLELWKMKFGTDNHFKLTKGKGGQRAIEAVRKISTRCLRGILPSFFVPIA